MRFQSVLSVTMAGLLALVTTTNAEWCAKITMAKIYNTPEYSGNPQILKGGCQFIIFEQVLSVEVDKQAIPAGFLPHCYFYSELECQGDWLFAARGGNIPKVNVNKVPKSAICFVLPRE